MFALAAQASTQRWHSHWCLETLKCFLSNPHCRMAGGTECGGREILLPNIGKTTGNNDNNGSIYKA